MRAGRPSQTALGVALGWTWVARRDSFAGLAPTAELVLTERMLEHVRGRVRRARWLLRRRWFSKAMSWLSEKLGPGIALHMLLRKRWFADTARVLLAEDRRQLVVLGAGLDAVAACVARERPDVGCFEIDHPDTQSCKRRALERAGYAAGNLHFLPLDLGRDEPWTSLLGMQGFRPEASTVFLAEGVLMYLERGDAVDLLGRLTAAAPGSALLYSYLRGDARGQPDPGRGGAILRRRLRSAGEPLRWGMPPGDEATWLRGTAWQHERWVGAEQLRELYPVESEVDLMDWEVLAVAKLRAVP